MSAQLPFRQSALPSALLRAFDEREYAQQFIEGRLRFGLLEHYKRSEDCRRDRTEGRASLTLVGGSHRRPVYYSLSSPNPHYYIICTMHPGVCGCTRGKYGRFAVHITDPLKLLERICAAWKHDARRSSSSPDGIWPVLYNKDARAEAAFDALYSDCLVYAQKPSAYEMDREHRYVLKCRSGTKKDEFLTLDVGTCTDICIPIFP
jgi:hypothetical protein